jgi:hypothetical protein
VQSAAVTVADNTTTTFSADATDADGHSACTATTISCTETTPPPTPPPAGSVTFSKKPPKKTKKRKATIKFTAPNAAGYECSLDGKPFKSCGSPFKTKKLNQARQAQAPGPSARRRRRQGPDGTAMWKVMKKKK